MTPDEARASLTDVFDATRDLLGGTWTISRKTWFACSPADGSEGAIFRFGAQRYGQPLTAGPAEVVDRVKVLWQSLGINASIVFHDDIAQYELSFPRFGLGPALDGSLIQLSVSDGFAAFSGSTQCVPGDSYELDLAEVGRTDE